MDFAYLALETIKDIPKHIFIFPLRTLYFNGPKLWGWGGWEGSAMEDICAQLTLIPASVWKEQAANCTALLEKKFATFAVTLGGLTYIFLLYKIVNYLWFRYFILTPMIEELRRCFPVPKVTNS